MTGCVESPQTPNLKIKGGAGMPCSGSGGPRSVTRHRRRVSNMETRLLKTVPRSAHVVGCRRAQTQLLCARGNRGTHGTPLPPSLLLLPGSGAEPHRLRAAGAVWGLHYSVTEHRFLKFVKISHGRGTQGVRPAPSLVAGGASGPHTVWGPGSAFWLRPSCPGFVPVFH